MHRTWQFQDEKDENQVSNGPSFQWTLATEKKYQNVNKEEIVIDGGYVVQPRFHAKSSSWRGKNFVYHLLRKLYPFGNIVSLIFARKALGSFAGNAH